MATQKLNIDIVARDRSKQALGKLQGSLGRLKQSVFNLRNAFIGLGAGLVIRNIVNTGKQIENLQVQLKFLFGSAKEGAKAFDEMAKFASKVPFSLEEIQKGSGVLAVVSDDAEELAKLMKITGNVAAVTGLDFKTTAEQIQRSLSAGISAADLFRDKGVKDMLGFSAGAKVSVEETVKAFERVFGEGGEFDGATDELAKTLSGTLSMIGDKVFNFKRVLLDAGFFSQLKKQFGDLDKALAKNSETMDKIAVTIGTVLAIAVERVANTFKLFAKYSTELGIALKVLISLKVGAMLIRWGRALIPIVASTRALISLTGVGLKLVAASVAAATGTYYLLGKQLDEIEAKINSNFDAQKKAYDPTMLLDQLGNTKKVTKELEEQTKKYKDTLGVYFHILHQKRADITAQEKINKLYEDAAILIEKHQMKELFIQTETNKKRLRFNELVNKGVEEFKKKNDLAGNLFEKIKDQNAQWSLSNEILTVVNTGVQGFSRMLAESVVYGKKINASFQELAKGLLVDILAKMIERIALVMIEEFILSKIIKKDKDKLAVEKGITKEKKKQVFYQALLMAMGGGSGGSGMKLFASGGAVSKGKPVVVGERGPEMFVPNSTGQITQNARGTGGESVVVNFNINTIDSRGFDEALYQNRGTITAIINNAVNEKGRRELI